MFLWAFVDWIYMHIKAEQIFLKYRPVIELDEWFLKRYDNGIILAALSIDQNDQMLLVAIVVTKLKDQFNILKKWKRQIWYLKH
jgi:hypothetical protein